MDDHVRQTGWLLILRLLSWAVAIALLPTISGMEAWRSPAFALVAFGMLGLASVSLWGRWGRQEPVIGLMALIEAVIITWLVTSTGGLTSPFVLLYLPLLAHAALALSSAGYALVAGYIGASHAVSVLANFDESFWTPFGPLWAALAALVVATLGLLGANVRDGQDRLQARTRRFRRFQGLLERLHQSGREEEFWRLFLNQTVRAGGFTDGALVIWPGLRPHVIATDRQTAWEGLATRHHAVFRQVVLKEGRPEVFVEEAKGRPARSIICWPIARRGGGEALGALCMLAPRVMSLAEAGRKLERWLALASLALSVGMPPVPLRRARVDWRVLMNVTLHRLHKRLAPYLVLVHVDPGAVEADAVLLADAIAHLIEAALDRTPPKSRIQVSVRRVGDTWRFEVETSSPVSPLTPSVERPGLALARQVVAAHGGQWEPFAGSDHFHLGFAIPAATEAAEPENAES